MSYLGDVLTEALEAKSNDVNSFIWKGPRINDQQEEIKLVNATYEQLRKFYKHCDNMLNNEDINNPGRLKLVKIVNDQIQRCRAELLVRWLLLEKHYPRKSCWEDLRGVIAENPDLTQEVIETYPIGEVLGGIPEDFQRIPISKVMSACLDTLGSFVNRHLSSNFILKLGLWFTKQELNELTRKDPVTGKTMDRRDVVRKEMGLSPKAIVRIDDTGLSYAEFKQMFKLRREKYANLTTEQLKLLSDKVLYRFQLQLEEQAKDWEDKIREIKQVAELKGWDVTREI